MFLTAVNLLIVLLAFMPLSLTFTILIFTILKYIVGLLLTIKYGEPIEFFSGADAMTGMNIVGDPVILSGYSIRKGELKIADLRNRVESNWLQPRNPADGSFKHKKLRSVMHYDMGYYFWLPNRNFRIEDCVYVYQGLRPKNDEEFHRVLGELTNTPIKAHSAPWQIIVIPLADNFSTLEPGFHNAILVRGQHYLCDGVSIMRLISALFDEPYDQLPTPPPKISLSLLDLVWYGFNMLIIVPLIFIRDLFVRENNIMCVDGEKTYKYLVGFSSYVSTARFKGLKNALGCTVNDVVMACITGAFRAHFLAEKALVPDFVKVIIPISKHDLNKPAEFCNRFSIAPFRCPVGAKIPLQRIQAVKNETAALKKSPMMINYTYIFFIKGLCSCILVWISKRLINLFKATGVVSNLPSPQKNIPLLGSPFLRLGFLVPFAGTSIGIGVSAATNFHGMQFGVLVDRAVFKEQPIVERFLKFIITEFEELERAAAALSTH